MTRISRLGIGFIAAMSIAVAGALTAYAVDDVAYLQAMPAALVLVGAQPMFHAALRFVDTMLSLRWDRDAPTSLEADRLAHDAMLAPVEVDQNKPFLAFMGRARESLRYSNGGFALDTELSPA